MPTQLPIDASPNTILVAGLVLVVLLLIVFCRKSIVADRIAADAERRATAGAKRVRALEEELVRSSPEVDRDDVVHLLDDLPRALQIPDDVRTPRRVAEALGAGLQRLIDPEQWMVFLDLEGDGKQFELLATASRKGGTWPAGACITPQMGRVGLVIRRKRTMERTDFLAEPPLVRDQVRESEPDVFNVDMATPIFVRDRVVGAISIGGSRKPADITRAVLRTVAGHATLARRLATAMQRAEQLENLDDTTGLLSRNGFLARSGELMFKLRDHVGPVSCAVLGIDDFPVYAGREGPAAARRLLRGVAERLGPAFRECDLVARWSESEFAVLLPGVGDAQAREMLDRIRHEIATTEFEGAATQPEGVVTLSVGLAIAPQDGTGLDALLDHAYRAFLTSRKRGGDRTSGEIEIEGDFLDALSDLRSKTPLRSPGDA